MGRRFPDADPCRVEVWGTKGDARIPFMWHTEGDKGFEMSMRRQVEAFARAAAGGDCEGARASDAIAAQRVAARPPQALRAGI